MRDQMVIDPDISTEMSQVCLLVVREPVVVLADANQAMAGTFTRS
jgi:hypothetical protein